MPTFWDVIDRSDCLETRGLDEKIEAERSGYLCYVCTLHGWCNCCRYVGLRVSVPTGVPAVYVSRTYTQTYARDRGGSGDEQDLVLGPERCTGRCGGSGGSKDSLILVGIIVVAFLALVLR
jgi:hypothetical protein